jgi:hypothetical protein
MPDMEVRAKLEALLARYRPRQARPTVREVEDIYTDACAEVLGLEAERLRLERRMAAAVADTGREAAAAEAAELQLQRDQIAEEVVALRRLVRLLRTARDWNHESEATERASEGHRGHALRAPSSSG